MRKPITLQLDAATVTFRELLDELLRFKKLENLSPRSIDFYEDCGERFAAFFGEATPCTDISEDTFYDYIEYLQKKNPDLRPSTLRSYLTGVRAILYYGMKKGYITQFTVRLPSLFRNME